MHVFACKETYTSVDCHLNIWSYYGKPRHPKPERGSLQIRYWTMVIFRLPCVAALVLFSFYFSDHMRISPLKAESCISSCWMFSAAALWCFREIYMQESSCHHLPEYQLLFDVPTYFLEPEESVHLAHVKKLHKDLVPFSGYVWQLDTTMPVGPQCPSFLRCNLLLPMVLWPFLLPCLLGQFPPFEKCA